MISARPGVSSRYRRVDRFVLREVGRVVMPVVPCSGRSRSRRKLDLGIRVGETELAEPGRSFLQLLLVAWRCWIGCRRRDRNDGSEDRFILRVIAIVRGDDVLIAGSDGGDGYVVRFAGGGWGECDSLLLEFTRWCLGIGHLENGLLPLRNPRTDE